ncbi:triphosphoribosyl-dephospho-CoA synthase MdcB [Rhodospirillum rubrum]|nr:triphosphoribosyl-dephospho-CoA synthase MdcB [Rhodospirillum rubrum]MBK1675278.1 triphosphoribosyl-dephospho-CoA synthase MdcB [Rhodospirillum rubrum]
MDSALRDTVRDCQPGLWRDPICWTIGSAFVVGALLEVSTHPKPGLVTPRSNGSHADMTLQTFMVSSAAIAPCFYQCAEAGFGHSGPAATVLPLVREIGREYEARLLAATGGINTQRGLLFSAGILCASAGLLARDQTPFSVEALFSTAALMTKGLCARELAAKAVRIPATAGEHLHQSLGILGIRGEVETGFPTVALAGLPALKAALAAGVPLNLALVHTLISLMSVTEDTTVLWRGGPQALDFIRTEARRVLCLGGAMSEAGRAAIDRFDHDCVARNLSPGGSADLLAVTVGVHSLLNGSLALGKI